MNQRIKQLALEAFEPINSIASEGVADRHTFDQEWFQLYNQKFAESIVAECIDSLRGLIVETGSDDIWINMVEKTRNSAIRQSESMIKQHLGTTS